MTVRRTVWLLAGASSIPLLIAACAFDAVASTDGIAPRDRVVFVVVPGLGWDAMPPSFDRWGKASLALNSVPRQRPIDVYLTMAKGRRTGGLPALAGVGPLEARGVGIAVRNWDSFQQHDRGLRFGGHLGELGELLEDHGVLVAVVGRSEDVAALIADRSGKLGGLALGEPNREVQAVGSARLVIVEAVVGDLERVSEATAGACRIVASGSAPPDEGLGAIAISPECGLGEAGLVSPSTRQPGFVALPDIAPTLLSLVGVSPPNIFEGGVVRAAHPVSRGRLIEEDRRSRVSRDVARPLTTVFVLAAMAGLLGVSRERLRLPVAAVILAMPAALLLMMLVPWWRYGRVAGIATLLVIAGLLAAATVAAAGREPARVVFVLCTATTALIAVDALRRGTLELDAPMVNNAIAAGRFAGVGNVPYGFLAASSIMAAALALERYGRRALVAVAVGLIFVVVADGAPMFGADAGGVLATVPAVGVLLLTWQGRRRWRLLALPAVAGLCALAAFGAFDISRPAAQRTHLGRTLTGGSGTATQTFFRRELTALNSFRTSQWVIVAAVALFGLAVVWGRVPTGTALRAGMAAIGVAAVIGAAANDSGVAVAGAILFVAWGVGLALARPPEAGGTRRLSPGARNRGIPRFRPPSPG